MSTLRVPLNHMWSRTCPKIKLEDWEEISQVNNNGTLQLSGTACCKVIGFFLTTGNPNSSRLSFWTGSGILHHSIEITRVTQGSLSWEIKDRFASIYDKTMMLEAFVKIVQTITTNADFIKERECHSLNRFNSRWNSSTGNATGASSGNESPPRPIFFCRVPP